MSWEAQVREEEGETEDLQGSSRPSGPPGELETKTKMIVVGLRQDQYQDESAALWFETGECAVLRFGIDERATLWFETGERTALRFETDERAAVQPGN